MFTNNHFNLLQKTIVKVFILLLILIPLQSQSQSVTFSEKPVDDDIAKASLIIKGTLLEHSSKIEDIPSYLRNDQDKIVTTVPHSIYTTYTFSVDEVIKGKYGEKNITIKVLGGCDDESASCDDYKYNYAFETNQQNIVFLKYDEENQIFRTTQDSYNPLDESNNINFTDKKLATSKTNIPPIANFNWSCNFLTCFFNANGSYDPDGFILFYWWSFFGVGSASGFAPVIYYPTGGAYIVSLQVQDNNFANSFIVTWVVNVTAPPVIENPDEYDDIAIRGYTDDVDGDAVSWPGGANTVQDHNFHDSGDTDWTMVWISSAATRNFSTEMVGNNSDTKIEVYKVTNVIVNPNYPNQNRFIINSKQLVGSDNSVGNSSVSVNTEANFLYVMKVESRTGDFGSNTDYKVRINTINHTPDQYDDIAIRGFTDDYEGDAVAWPGGVNTVHNHTFHDSGDADWTMVWISVSATRNFTTELVGANSDTKIEVYKFTDVSVNPSYPNDNRFIINAKTLVGSDSSVGDSSVTVNVDAGFLYAVKVQSRTGTYGAGTDYKVRIN